MMLLPSDLILSLNPQHSMRGPLKLGQYRAITMIHSVGPSSALGARRRPCPQHARIRHADITQDRSVNDSESERLGQTTASMAAFGSTTRSPSCGAYSPGGHAVQFTVPAQHTQVVLSAIDQGRFGRQHVPVRPRGGHTRPGSPCKDELWCIASEQSHPTIPV